jgi:hypothetical protein
MAELDKIPQTQTVEIAPVKLDDETYNQIKELNVQANAYISDFGQIYLRKKEIADELVKLDDILAKGEIEFKGINAKIKEIVDSLDDKYPAGRLDMTNGNIQYQPNAPTKKQLAEQQAAAAASQTKVVKQ